jgi:multiple sugar transport system permease protein
MINSQIRRFIGRRLWFYLAIGLLLIIVLFPFYWMFITSLKSNMQLYDFSGDLFWVRKPSLANYISLFKTQSRVVFATAGIRQWAVNSIYVSVITTVISVVLSTMAGYSIARLRYRGATLFGVLIFITYLVPKTLLFIPLAQVLSQIDLLGKTPALLLAYPTFVIPFCAWLLTGYFRTIPIDLEECAMIDGCTRMGALRFITLPLSVPGVVTAAIFSFTLSWNDLLYALAFVSGEASKTLPLGITSSLVMNDYYYWGPLMAAALLSSIPVAVIYFFFVDLYVSGLTAGAVKG